MNKLRKNVLEDTCNNKYKCTKTKRIRLYIIYVYSYICLCTNDSIETDELCPWKLFNIMIIVLSNISIYINEYYLSKICTSKRNYMVYKNRKIWEKLKY